MQNGSDKNRKHVLGTVAAGLAGAAMGAAAVALSDKNNQKKLKKMLHNTQKTAVELKQKAKQKVDTVRSKMDHV
jgi:broad specificity polyphosphatase/5'/3'-nucleotidase SurE